MVCRRMDLAYVFSIVSQFMKKLGLIKGEDFK